MLKQTKQWWKDNWDSNKYIENMLLDPKKFIRVMALFCKLKKYNFSNYDQVQWFIARNSRSAKRLECFETAKIQNTLIYLLETADYKVGFETIEKHIMENFEELKGEEPIIILLNGEKIYDIKRIQELESTGSISYKQGKWIEKCN